MLLVEDDLATRRSLAANLRAHGYGVDDVGTAAEALRQWDASRPDLVLLDLGLPDRDGLYLLRRVRRDAATPILILSARDQEADKVEALESGADDYLTKPFGLPELRARMTALLRRSGGSGAASDGTLRLGALRLDPLRREVTVHGRAMALTPREFELLRVLLTDRGRVITRARLLRQVWGSGYVAESHYLHVYVSRLRRKLAEADPSGETAASIVADPGVGYRITDP